MANLIYTCWRGPDPGVGRETLEQVAERITPVSIRGRGHRFQEGPGECWCLTGPGDAAGFEGGSAAHLGVFSRPGRDWHRPGAPVPDGSFALVRSEPETSEVWSDYAGSRTLWYVFTDRFLAASTSQRALVCLLKDFSCNKAAFAWFLSSGTLGPSDSWDLRIRRLSRGAHLSLDRSRWTLERHTTPVLFEARSMSASAAQEGLREVVASAVKGCDLQCPPWILPLSGGYDSRILLALLHAEGIRPRTVTWGVAASRSQPGNDAYVARELARHYGVTNDYLFTEVLGAAPEEIVDAFLSAHGGTTDGLFPYLDGLKLWSGFTAEGVGGIIRGDEGFGTRPRPELNHRFAQGLILLRDFLGEADAEMISDGGQAIPEELLRRPGESVQTYGDRLVHSFFIPVDLASLNDVKAPFLEIANPLLAGSVLSYVRQMPDGLRVGRAAYKNLTQSLSPPIGFATLAADDSRSGFLQEGRFRHWIARELEGGFSERMLPQAVRRSLLASVRDGSTSILDSRYGRSTLKRIIPESWVVAVRSWRKPDPPETRTLAFRCALASRLEHILKQDSVFLAKAAPVA